MHFHRIASRHRLTNNDAPADPYVMTWFAALANAGNVPSDDALQRVAAIVSAYRRAGSWDGLYRLWVFGLDNVGQATLDVKALAVASPETGTPFIPGMGFAADTQAHWISLNCNATEPGAGYTPDANSYTGFTAQRPGQPAPHAPGAFSSVRLAPDNVRLWRDGVPGPVIANSPPMDMSPAGLGFTTSGQWPGASLDPAKPYVGTVQACAIIGGPLSDQGIAILHTALADNAVRP